MDDQKCIEGWLDAARRQKLTLYASASMLVEARGSSHAQPNPEAEARLRTLLTDPMVRLVEVDRRVALKARDIALKHRTSGLDAIHLASAELAGAGVFFTHNKRDFPVGSRWKAHGSTNPTSTAANRCSLEGTLPPRSAGTLKGSGPEGGCMHGGTSSRQGERPAAWPSGRSSCGSVAGGGRVGFDVDSVAHLYLPQ
ncbi:PIN domain-containing protein [Streptomyces sp. TRM66268-LWL]|uniref:PIN domain-containing protein n=2 Tax=Streptomyces polyasparticus TaxID=2767826 RepID=A0ABR7SYS8_9ACTN|nr:PIN domain-containing protein [Streptomyces polyasparticus]